ncbi:transcription antitermination factor NusB [Streptococcus sp. DD12]|uniref:transcription antitermination factor NusB n=1 Tax=Streptococcus sp. DD12 TaxID=1777880 RepID=UPI0007914B89|nr:transcription antitermination factor NusB [Streptococcus sp. DD12]KXT75939.1 Transcription termination protein NusB [Streptococcus sp. DD12]
MTERQTFNSRHDLRERALQALFALEFTGEPLDQAYFAYTYDKATEADETYDVPSFLLQLVTGVVGEQKALDEAISAKLKKGWRLERLSVIDRCLLRLGLYEIAYYEGTPGRVAINEIIELSKGYSEEESSKFINGILTQFVKED